MTNVRKGLKFTVWLLSYKSTPFFKEFWCFVFKPSTESLFVFLLNPHFPLTIFLPVKTIYCLHFVLFFYPPGQIDYGLFNFPPIRISSFIFFLANPIWTKTVFPLTCFFFVFARCFPSHRWPWKYQTVIFRAPIIEKK